MVSLVRDKDIELPFEPSDFFVHGGNIYVCSRRMQGRETLPQKLLEPIGEGIWKTPYIPSCALGDALFGHSRMSESLFIIRDGEIEFFQAPKPNESDLPYGIFPRHLNPGRVDSDGKRLYVTFGDDVDNSVGTSVLKDMKIEKFIPVKKAVDVGSDGRQFYFANRRTIKVFREGVQADSATACREEKVKGSIGLARLLSDGEDIYRLTRKFKEYPVIMRPLKSGEALASFKSFPASCHDRGYMMTLSEEGLQVFRKGERVSKGRARGDFGIWEIMADSGVLYGLATTDKAIRRWHLED